jgi:hypothetical protein
MTQLVRLYIPRPFSRIRTRLSINDREPPSAGDTYYRRAGGKSGATHPVGRAPLGMVNRSPISLWQIEALVATMLFEDQPGRSLRRILLSENNIRNECGRREAMRGVSKRGSRWQDLRKIRAFVHRCTRGITNRGFPGSSTDRQAHPGRMVIAETIVVRRSGWFQEGGWACSRRGTVGGSRSGGAAAAQNWSL